MYRRNARHGPYAQYDIGGALRLLSGSYADGELDGVWTEWLDGQRMRQLTFEAGVLSGEAKQWDPQTGSVWTVQIVDGKVHGPVTKTTNDGRVLVSGEFEKGQWSGAWRFLGPDGQSLGGCELPRATGGCEVFHPNGQLERRATYVDGRGHGRSESYYDNGQLCLVFEYEHGELRSRQCFERNGSRCPDYPFLMSGSEEARRRPPVQLLRHVRPQASGE